MNGNSKSALFVNPKGGPMDGMDYLCSDCLTSRPRRFLASLVACALALSFSTIVQAQTSVTTYHDDAQRTGWNSSETTLTPAKVTPTTFGLIASVALDEEVDAQPLVVANQTITGQGVHTVVYAATQNNTVYAIDSLSGAILEMHHLGAPVPDSFGPCQPKNLGIFGTPTIDVERQHIYLVAYILVSGQPTFQLHALNLQTLQDIPGSPVTITASHKLVNGSVLNFNPKYERQHAALLESSGNIYAAFAGPCTDAPASLGRGWLLGWNAGTLAALAANELTDTLVTAPTPSGKNFFLNSIWMSGYGVAADELGNLYFSTGNSDPDEDTYTGTTNIQESVVKMPPALTSVSDLFTPANVFKLDQNDEDYSAGGVLVLPDQPGPIKHVAVAAGKNTNNGLFILNRDDLGGFHDPNIPGHVAIGACWCGESYYQGSDGVGRVVTSGGNYLSNGDSQSKAETWKVNTALSPALTLEASSPELAIAPQDPGFFTSVSSNGTTSNTAIIWAVGRPTGSDDHVTLYAFNGTAQSGSLTQLWSDAAGYWPDLTHNATLVPTVANGRVNVASDKQLAIFGLTPAPKKGAVKLQEPVVVPEPKPAGAVFWGTIESIHGTHIVLALRTGKLLQVDLGKALEEGTATVPLVGRNVEVNGDFNPQGVLEAHIMWRVKGPQSWGADSPA
jgi:hypothetical protein